MEKSILFANIVNYFTLCTIFTEFLYHFDKNPPIIIPDAQLHKPKGRFFWFVVWFVPDALIHLHCCLRQKQTKRTALWFENPPIIIPNAQLPGHIQCHHIVNGIKNKMIS